MKYTLAFDVYGTLIDTEGVLDTLKLHIGEKAEAVMELWRNKQLEYSFRRGLMDSFVDFSVCTKQALEYSCNVLEVPLNAEVKSKLMATYATLPPFSDVKSSLEELKENRHRLFAFSNGSKKALIPLLTQAGILSYFEDVVSVESTKVFKPSPKVYAHFNARTSSEKNTTFLISGNPFDALGALSYGMKSAWVQRSPKKHFDPWELEPTLKIKSLSELKQALASLS